MPPRLHRLAMQPQTESASNLLFGGAYGSPSTLNCLRPQYTPSGSATMTAGGTPLSIPNTQPFNYSGQQFTPSPSGFMSTYRPVQTHQGRIGSGHPSEHAQDAQQQLSIFGQNSAPMSNFNGHQTGGPLNLASTMLAVPTMSPYRAAIEAANRSAATANGLPPQAALTSLMNQFPPLPPGPTASYADATAIAAAAAASASSPANVTAAPTGFTFDQAAATLLAAAAQASSSTIPLASPVQQPHRRRSGHIATAISVTDPGRTGTGGSGTGGSGTSAWLWRSSGSNSIRPDLQALRSTSR